VRLKKKNGQWGLKYNFLKVSISMSQEKLMISDGKEHLMDHIPFDILLGQIVFK